MDIFRNETKEDFYKFILFDSKIKGNRRRSLSSLPLHTISNELLIKILKRNNVPYDDINNLVSSINRQNKIIGKIIEANIFQDEIPELSKEEFKVLPMRLSLSDSFYEKDIYYNYEDYLEHLTSTKEYAKNNNNYILKIRHQKVFNNIQISIHEDKWLMLSKNNCPSIHFVIYHTKLRNAIENFIPPIIEQKENE